jgi:hypothetical protein
VLTFVFEDGGDTAVRSRKRGVDKRRVLEEEPGTFIAACASSNVISIRSWVPIVH